MTSILRQNERRRSRAQPGHNLRLVLAALGALLAAAANVKLFVEQQWQFATLLLVRCLAGVRLFDLREHAVKSAPRRKLVRLGAAIVLTGIPVVTTAVFYQPKRPLFPQ